MRRPAGLATVTRTNVLVGSRVARDMATRTAVRRPGGPRYGRLDALRTRLDDWRVREHLRRTERALRAAATDERADARPRHLDRLREYRERGEFPRNRHARERSPVFVDDSGTHCAVGYLLHEDGRADLVREVVERENTVRVEDLPDDDPVLDWAEANGLSREDLARIQPSYGPAVRFATTCGPVSCAIAAVLASVAGLVVAGALEWVGYRLCGRWFPDNALKRRSAVAYLTVLNLLLAPLLATLVYALFP